VEKSHPPYSPHISPADFFPFLWWKLPSNKTDFRMLKTLRKMW
jgi:hypothetical protein